MHLGVDIERVLATIVPFLLLMGLLAIEKERTLRKYRRGLEQQPLYRAISQPSTLPYNQRQLATQLVPISSPQKSG